MKKLDKKKIITLCIIAFICIFIFLAVCLQESILNAMSKWLTVNKPAEKADVIVVMGGATERRIPFGINLYKKGAAEKIIFISGLNDKWRLKCREKYGVPLLDCEVIKIIAEKNGLQDNNYAIIENSLSTLDDAEKLMDYYKKNPFGSAIIVTDSLHSRRTMNCMNSVFKKSGVKLYSNPIPIEKEIDMFSDRHDYYVYVVDEYIKFFFYSVGFKKSD